MKLAAVVLAAGASERMGRPKPLVPWRGRPLVAHCIERAREVGADPIVVVEGAFGLGEAVEPPAKLVLNAGWRDGPLSSLQEGLRDMPRERHLLVLTVDRPHVQAATVEALVSAARTEPTAIWQPQCAGKHGHPILYPPDVVQELIALARTDTPRSLLAREDLDARRRFVDVDDTAVLDNIDRPEDLASLPK